MTLSLPCRNCGQVVDLETVNPIGIFAGVVVLWNCQCGNTRGVELAMHPPLELIRKAMEADEMKKLNTGHEKTG